MLILIQMSSCALKPNPSPGYNWPRERDQVCSLGKELLLTVKHSYTFLLLPLFFPPQNLESSQAMK